MREKLTEERFKDFTKQAYNQMAQWNVMDEKNQKIFNAKLIENLDRVKYLDHRNKVHFDEEEIKKEFTTGKDN